MERTSAFIHGIFSQFAVDFAIDLGTSNTRIALKNRGIVLNEPTVISYHKKTKATVAVGKQAEEMFGKTPQQVVSVRPLERGVISDFDRTAALLKIFVQRVRKGSRRLPWLFLPQMVMGIPAGVTEVERKAVVDAGLAAGARRVYLVEEPVAAAMGADLPIRKARASLVMDMGGGTTEIAVLSWGGLVVSRSLPVAGNVIDNAITLWLKEHKNVVIGEMSAELLKKKLGAIPSGENSTAPLTINGRDLSSGLPIQIAVNKEELREAINPPLMQIVEAVKDVIEETPPELVSDLVPRGIIVTGGGALLGGLEKLLSKRLEIPIKIAEAPDLAVIKGLARIMQDRQLLESVQVAWGH